MDVGTSKTQLDYFVENHQRDNERVVQFLPGNGKHVPGRQGNSSVPGALILTNHRLVFVSPGTPNPHLHSVNIDAIQQVEETSTGGQRQFVFTGPDFKLKLVATPEKKAFINALRQRFQKEYTHTQQPSRRTIDLTQSDVDLVIDPDEFMTLSRAMTLWTRDGRIVTTLVLLFPPLGMYLIWSNPNWSAPWKKGLATAWCLVIAMLYWMGTTSSPSVAKSNRYKQKGQVHGAALSEETADGSGRAAKANASGQASQDGAEESLEALDPESLDGHFYSDIAAAVDAETRFHFEDETLSRGEGATELHLALPIGGEESPASIRLAVKQALVRVAFTVMRFTDTGRAHIYVTPFRTGVTREGAVHRVLLEDHARQLVVTRALTLEIIQKMLGAKAFSALFKLTSEGSVPTDICQEALTADGHPGITLVFDALAKETPLRDWRAERLQELRKVCGPPPTYDERKRTICGAADLARPYAPDPNGLMVDECTRPELDERCWRFTCQVTGRNNNGIYVSRRQQMHAAHVADCELQIR